jgi:hypothetical protein
VTDAIRVSDSVATTRGAFATAHLQLTAHDLTIADVPGFARAANTADNATGLEDWRAPTWSPRTFGLTMAAVVLLSGVMAEAVVREDVTALLSAGATLVWLLRTVSREGD